jgi:hypothetical protein
MEPGCRHSHSGSPTLVCYCCWVASQSMTSSRRLSYWTGSFVIRSTSALVSRVAPRVPPSDEPGWTGFVNRSARPVLNFATAASSPSISPSSETLRAANSGALTARSRTEVDPVADERRLHLGSTDLRLDPCEDLGTAVLLGLGDRLLGVRLAGGLECIQLRLKGLGTLVGFAPRCRSFSRADLAPSPSARVTRRGCRGRVCGSGSGCRTDRRGLGRRRTSAAGVAPAGVVSSVTVSVSPSLSIGGNH